MEKRLNIHPVDKHCVNANAPRRIDAEYDVVFYTNDISRSCFQQPTETKKRKAISNLKFLTNH